MTRLLLIRHGQTEHNAEGRLSTAPPGGPLSELGVEQGNRLAAGFARGDLDVIYTSPLIRACQTADLIGRRIGLGPIVHEGLAEISIGELDGRADQDAFDILHLAQDAWCRCEYEVRVGRTGDVGTAVCERFAEVVRETAARHPGATVALVSHGGLLQAGASSISTNLPPGFALGRFLTNTGVVELEVEGERVRCVSWEGVDPRDLVREEGAQEVARPGASNPPSERDGVPKVGFA